MWWWRELKEELSLIMTLPHLKIVPYIKSVSSLNLISLLGTWKVWRWKGDTYLTWYFKLFFSKGLPVSIPRRPISLSTAWPFIFACNRFDVKPVRLQTKFIFWTLVEREGRGEMWSWPSNLSCFITVIYENEFFIN